MLTNQKSDKSGPVIKFVSALRFSLRDAELRRRYALVAAACCVCLAVFIACKMLSGTVRLGGFEAGKVADRDVIAESDISYTDIKATRIRVEAESRLVPAVFVLDESAAEAALTALDAFRRDFTKLLSSPKRDDIALKMRSVFPDLASSDFLTQLLDYPAPANAIQQAKEIVTALMQRGVFAFPDKGLESYNLETVELRRRGDGPLVYEQVPIERAITRTRVKSAAMSIAKPLKLSATLTALSVDIAATFTRENAFYDADQSRRRLDAAKSRIEPIVRKIKRGEKVIRQGFIVEQDDMERLAALRSSASPFNLYFLLSGLLVMLVLVVVAGSAMNTSATGIRLTTQSLCFVLSSTTAYFILASVLNSFLPAAFKPYIEVFLPTAFLAMLSAVLIGERFALPFTVFLASTLLLITGFDAFVLAEAMFSGIVGIIFIRKATRRSDLVKAGGWLAIVRYICAFALASFADKGLYASLSLGLWAAVNGFLCAVLALAFLPALEYALNAPTVFRLQDLSDLNAPALKRLLSVAPGTYSHSVTVAHLAESACREIGSNALLARVGAYYHDIGKIEKPEYFIENQAGYNKHDEINPRLSATVLRGHVKFGLERADALRLPAEVKAIIAEHHGTSLISYFFAQAQKADDGTNSEEFKYPGPLPASKESAVVMLADCVEAASRTVKRPTMAKLEQFVKDMVMSKYESAQLSMSALTFRDLELIKNSFVRVLSGHFHSRIEYPKTREHA